MVTLSQLVRHLDETLRLADFASDCSNNGLQAEGKREVRRAVFGVDACQALFLEAERRDADFIFVHHGMSWGANPRRFTGIVAARLRMLFAGNRSLYAAHLPLDAHPVGVRTAALSIPVRYIRTGAETADLGDVSACAALVGAFLK